MEIMFESFNDYLSTINEAKLNNNELVQLRVNLSSYFKNKPTTVEDLLQKGKHLVDFYDLPESMQEIINKLDVHRLSKKYANDLSQDLKIGLNNIFFIATIDTLDEKYLLANTEGFPYISQILILDNFIPLNK